MICTTDSNAQENTNTSASSYKRDEAKVGKKQVKKKEEIAGHRTAQNRGTKAKQRKRTGNTSQKQRHHRIASSSPPR